MKIIHLGRLPGLNELIGSANQHWAVGYRLKKEAMRDFQVSAMIAKVKPIHGVVDIKITCFEPNRKRDHDNIIAGANKIILDALQEMGVLKGDGQKYLRSISDSVQIDKENPRVEVEIIE